MKEHKYKVQINWTGNNGTGTDHYKNFERSHNIKIDNKPDISGSSDAAFRGDKTKHNPEELLLASISSCHMLWYLHLCSEAKVIVVDYVDHAIGIMKETANGGGKFTEVALHPIVTVTEASMVDKAKDLHKKANLFCFIANSVNFQVKHEPTIKILE